MGVQKSWILSVTIPANQEQYSTWDKCYAVLEKDMDGVDLEQLWAVTKLPTRSDSPLPNDKEKAALKKALLKRETENMPALILFGQGIDSADRGDYAAAVKLLRNALSEDPDFELAKKVLNEVEALEVARGQDLSIIETDVVRRIKSQAAIHDRFSRMDSALTREFAPPSAADATLEGDAPPPKTSITITVKQ